MSSGPLNRRSRCNSGREYHSPDSIPRGGAIGLHVPILAGEPAHGVVLAKKAGAIEIVDEVLLGNCLLQGFPTARSFGDRVPVYGGSFQDLPPPTATYRPPTVHLPHGYRAATGGRLVTNGYQWLPMVTNGDRR